MSLALAPTPSVEDEPMARIESGLPCETLVESGASAAFERTIGGQVGLAEPFRVTFGGHDQLGGMGEGRVTSPADPRQELTAFFGIPRAHKLVGLKPRIVFNSKIIKRIIAHMHAPEAPE